MAKVLKKTIITAVARYFVRMEKSLRHVFRRSVIRNFGFVSAIPVGKIADKFVFAVILSYLWRISLS